MKNNAKKILKAGVVLFIAVLFVGMSTSAIGATPEKAAFISTKKTTTPSEPTRDETELKYYAEENLDQVIGLTGTTPIKWKTAIRLTQDELAPYADWTLKKVNVAFSADNGQPTVDVRIYIYDKGTNIKPGTLIASDTTAFLDTTGVATIELNTSVPLAGHDEIWVAVEWTQTEAGPGVYYAWMDTLSGPHIQNKSDFVYLNNAWSQLHDPLPTADGRWGIGAIVEGQGLAQLAIGNIKGPIGIKADVQNTGAVDATNVEWSIVVTGGLLKRINSNATGTAPSLLAGASTPASIGMFIGFGKISIVITAKAQNALQVSATKSAFLLGPIVVGIK